MIYLAMVRVLANLEANSPDEAARILVSALGASGFMPFPEGAEPGDVIPSEDDEPSGIPHDRL